MSELEREEFGPENDGIVNFIMLSRIYDVLMGILTTENSVLAQALIEKHAQGDLAGVPPSFSGVFLSGQIDE